MTNAPLEMAVARLASPNADIITFAEQSALPIVAAVSRVGKVQYAETVLAISSCLAEPETRANIDEFVEATARALESLGGATRGRAILILNPAEPPPVMRGTIFVLSEDADTSEIQMSIETMVARVQAHVPGYRLKQAVQFERVRELRIPGLGTFSGVKTSVFLEVEGSADHLPEFTGDLDIMISAALATTGEQITRVPGA